MPRRRGVGVVVTLQRRRFSTGRDRRRLARIEADHYHLEVASGLERHHVERRSERVQYLGTEKRAVVVDKGEHHRPRSEKVAEHDVTASFIAERHIERDLSIEILIESDFSERRG